MTCEYCETAQKKPDYPLYRAFCQGCAVRALAQGPDFHRCSADGKLSRAYVEALRGIFGDAWEDGHARVKVEDQRIRAARQAAKT